MEEIGNAVDVERMMAEVGGKARRARASRGMTLGGLSAASGVSVAHLSRLESGGRQPSLATLLNVAAGLGVSISELVEERPRPGIVVRGSESPFHEMHGLRFQSLTPEAGPAGISAIRIVFPKGLDQEEHQGGGASGYHRHEGEEWLYVVSGRVRLTLGEDVVELERGDAAYFDGMLRHSFAVIGDEDAHMLMVARARSGSARSLPHLHERHGFHGNEGDANDG